MAISRRTESSFSTELKQHTKMLQDVKEIGLIFDQAKRHPESYTQEKDEFIKKTLKKWPEIEFHKKALKEVTFEKRKEKMIKNFPEGTLDSLNVAISVMSYISNNQIQIANKEKPYQEILDLTRKAKRSKRKLIELKALFDKNRNKSLKIIGSKLKKLEQEYFGPRYQAIKAIENSDKKDKDTILERIYNGCRAKGDSELFRLISRLKQDIRSLKDNILFDPELAIKIRSNDRSFTKRVALAIYKPHYLSYSYVLCDIKFSNILIELFFNNLPIVNIIDIFLAQESGHNISAIFSKKYKSKSGCKELKDLIESEYLCKPFSQIIDKNKQPIYEMLSCYNKNLLYPATCALLSIIEGIIWSFAEFLDTVFIKIFSYNEQHEIKSIVNADSGIENTNVTIGTLLNTSHVNRFLNKDFIKYFCNELYCERNNILHGSSYETINLQKTSEQMAVFEYILEEINKYIKKFWIDLYTSSIPSEYLDILAKKSHQ